MSSLAFRGDRQNYITSTIGAAIADGCDIVQYKYRGIWVRCELSRGIARLYDPHGELVTFSPDIPEGVVGTLIGDLFGPPDHEISQVIIWDCWATGMEPEENDPHIRMCPLLDYTYRDRLAFAKSIVGQVGLPFTAIKTFPISEAQTLWDRESFLPTCGLVYRRSKDRVAVDLRVARKYKEVLGGVP